MFKRIMEKVALRPGRKENTDSTPMSFPVGMKRPPTLQEQIQRYIQVANLMAAQNEAESFEEADDFDVDDDFDPSTPYELVFDPTLNKEVTKSEKAFMDAQRSEFDSHVAEHKKRKKKFEEEKPKGRTEGTPSGATRGSDEQ